MVGPRGSAKPSHTPTRGRARFAALDPVPPKEARRPINGRGHTLVPCRYPHKVSRRGRSRDGRVGTAMRRRAGFVPNAIADRRSVRLRGRPAAAGTYFQQLTQHLHPLR